MTVCGITRTGQASSCYFRTTTGNGARKALVQIGERAVEILARDLGKPLRELGGSDVAYDVRPVNTVVSAWRARA